MKVGVKNTFSFSQLSYPPPPASPEHLGLRWRAGFIPSSPGRRLYEPEAARGEEIEFPDGY